MILKLLTRLVCLLSAACFCVSVKAQCPAAIPPQIDNVTTTESRCAATGSITVNASNGLAPYTYAITAGPVTAALQSSNVFSGLPPGTYTVQVRDACNTPVNLGGVAVAGSYGIPNPTSVLQMPRCIGGSNGKIMVSVAGGRAPFTYAITAPVAYAQSSGPTMATTDTFYNLPAGTYTYTVTDSCSNVQTRNVTIGAATASTFTTNTLYIQWLACDSFKVKFYVSTNNILLRPPYNVAITTPAGGTINHVINDSVSSYTTYYDSVNVRLSPKDSVVYNTTDGCGTSVRSVTYMSTYVNMYTTPVSSAVAGCGRQLAYTGDSHATNVDPNRTLCPTVTYQLMSLPDRTVVASQTNNSTFSGYTVGTTYKIFRVDCCGRTDSTNSFVWQQIAPLRLNAPAIYADYTCRQNSAYAAFSVQNASSPVSLVMLSGPATATFGDGVVRNLVYPDTIKNFTGYQTGYFTAGTYRVIVYDTCGQTDSVSFTITSAQVRSNTLTATYIQGCVGANKIAYQLTTPSSTNGINSNVSIAPGGYFKTGITALSFRDTLSNLASGTYTVTMGTGGIGVVYFPQFNGIGCDLVRQTVVIPAYQQPSFLSPLVAVCTGQRQVAIIPDSTKGAPPYTFDITAGPVTRASQSSPVFPNLPTGTYTFRITDACGNSYSNSASINNLVIPPVTTTGSTCLGSNAQISLPNYAPYYSYTWTTPSGTVVTGNTITLNPVAYTDTGTYQVMINANIAGCQDSLLQTTSLVLCQPVAPLPLKLLGFAGSRKNHIDNLQWSTAQEEGIRNFVIEYSMNGYDFTSKGTVAPANDHEAIHNYSFSRSGYGTVFYRIKVVENGGRYSYSNTIKLDEESTATGNGCLLVSNVSPVPFTDKLTLTISSCSDLKVDISITDMAGKSLVRQSVSIIKGNTAYTFGGLQAMPSGIYLLRIVAPDGMMATQQIVK